jgi:hypothetical protein
MQRVGMTVASVAAVPKNAFERLKFIKCALISILLKMCRAEGMVKVPSLSWFLN